MGNTGNSMAKCFRTGVFVSLEGFVHTCTVHIHTQVCHLHPCTEGLHIELMKHTFTFKLFFCFIYSLPCITLSFIHHSEELISNVQCNEVLGK